MTDSEGMPDRQRKSVFWYLVLPVGVVLALTAAVLVPHAFEARSAAMQTADK